jgi:uncharacterized protein
MRNSMKSFFLAILSVIVATGVFAQNDSLPQIKVIGRALKDKVLLRWAPTTPLSWQIINKYGYTIERVTMTKNNKLIKDRKLQKLTASPLKPWPEEKWEPIAYDEKGEVNKYVAIAAQAIFGGSFELTESYSNDITKVIEKSQENEKRFTFALFAADQSLKVAEAMGLYYVDNNVVEDEKYLYRIYANVPNEEMALDTGFIYIGPPDYAELPRPYELHGDFEEKMVTLTWNRELFEQIYSNYEVQRSDNGKEFFSIDDLPFINTAPMDKPNPRLMYRMDSLPENNLTYYYRIRGRTPFDEWGPWSDTISGQSIVSLKFKPMIREANVIDNKAVELKWEFPEEHNQDIEYFALLRANKANGNYVELAGNLNPSVRTFTDEKPNVSNYYIVRAFNSSKDASSSFPYFAQLVDSFPPAPPTGLKAMIDTTGLVTLSWKLGPEEDILGYRVFRSNFAAEEFGQMTKSPVKDTVYYETIKLKNLSRKIYYKIAVIDRNFNQSEFSDVVMLLKPDVVPPTPPLFKAPKSKKEGAQLGWINSSSKDVIKHVLYRRKANDEGWVTVAVFPVTDSVQQFVDRQITPKLLYEYIMLAVDSANNESKPCKSVFVRKIDTGIRPAIEDIETNIDETNKQIEIKWEYPYKDVKNYLIYRAKDESPIRYYQLIPADNQEFKDKKVIINTKYRYRIKAKFEDGSESAFSEEVLVEF